MNWKGASLGVCSRGALFHKLHFFAIPILITPVFVFVWLFFFFFFHYLRCFFLAPISMLRFSAPFPTPLTPLDPFRFLYVFVNILAPFSYFCLLPLFPVSFIIFAAPWFLSSSLFGLKILNILAPFLASFPCSLAPSLLIVSYCHSWVATCVFFFLYPIFFWFLPSFPFLLYIFFPFPSLLLWRTFSFPFILPLSLLLSFSPLLFGAPLRPPGVQAHAMHPPRIRHCLRVLLAKCTSFHYEIMKLKITLKMCFSVWKKHFQHDF